MRIGLLGGTFDPVHAGHIFIAEEARIRLELELVLFIVAGRPWLKLDRDISPAELRVEMVRLSIAKHEHFVLSTVEVDRGGPSYMVDTLDELRTTMGENEYYLILGRDSFTELPLWKQAERIVELCKLVVVQRKQLRLVGLFTLLPSLFDLLHQYVIFLMLGKHRIEIRILFL